MTQYMFSVTDSVANKSGQAQTLYPFAYVAREGVPKEQTSWVLHQGFVGVANGSETDANYSRLQGRRHAAQEFLLHRRLGGHHRQILDGGGDPAPGRNL